MNPQIQALAKGVDVLVACPGRLLDLAGQNKVDLSHGNPRPRRSRPHARHGLHPRCEEGSRQAAAQAPEPAVLGYLLERHRRPRQQAPAQPGTHRGNAAEHHGRAHRATRVPPAGAAEARPAGAPGDRRRLGTGAGLHPYQARRQPSRRVPDQARPAGRRDPWQQEPERADQGAGRLQGQRRAHPGGDRHRRPRPGYRPVAPCGQLRTAQRRGRLRPPHRPYRPDAAARRSRWWRRTKRSCSRPSRR